MIKNSAVDFSTHSSNLITKPSQSNMLLERSPSSIKSIEEGVVPAFAPGWHDLISLNHESLSPAIVELANTQAFRRLEGINHAGFSPHGDIIYSRALHSLVAMAVSRRILANPSNCADAIRFSVDEILAGALIHDIGHGAASHSAERAFNAICHKGRGVEIVRTDSEIQGIFSKYRLNTQSVINAGTKKSDGNPFTVKRKTGHLSLDHLANLFTDVHMREDEQLDQPTLERILNALYLNQQAKLALPDDDNGRELAKIMVEWVIKQNEAIFSARSMLYDTLGETAMKALVKADRLSVDDLQESEETLRTAMANSEAPDIVREIHYAIEYTIAELDDDTLSKIIYQDPSGEINPGDVWRRNRKIYLLTPMIGEHPAANVLPDEVLNNPFAKVNAQLSGLLKVDMNRLKAENQRHRSNAGRSTS